MSLDTKILIIEDEILIADYIKELLQTENFTSIRIAHDAESALNEMDTFLPDIILMDINLKGKNSGIELAKSKNQDASLIFLTGQNDPNLIFKALESNPEAYLTKPIKKMDLLASINLILYKKKKHSFKFKDGYDSVNLEYSNIIYIVADGNYINIITDSKKYTIRESLNAFAEKLPSELFLQSHRSYFVNKNKVQRVTKTSVYINGLEIPLSRTYAKGFK